MVYPTLNRQTKPFVIPGIPCFSEGQETVFFKPGIIANAKKLFVHYADPTFDLVQIESESLTPVRLLVEAIDCAHTSHHFFAGKEGDQYHSTEFRKDLNFEYKVTLVHTDTSDRLEIGLEITKWTGGEDLESLRIAGVAIAANIVPISK